MKNLFEGVCRRVGNPEKCEAAFVKLAAQHQISERFYHTFDGHIAFCIKELEKIPASTLSDKDAVAMALFMHDAVMDFFQKTNEESSAEFAIGLCRQMEMPRQFGEKVAGLIMVTKHDAVCEPGDMRIVSDIDLAILGQDVEIFSEYEKNIRREYAFVPEDIYKTRRIRLLEKFLNRPSIFLTDYFRSKYEERARENIKNAIAQMER